MPSLMPALPATSTATGASRNPGGKAARREPIALADLLLPGRSQVGPPKGSYNIEAEVTIVAAGHETWHRARALRDWLAGPDDDVITRLALLEAAGPREHAVFASTRASHRLQHALDASDLVVVVLGDAAGWGALFHGPYAPLAGVDQQKLIAVYPDAGSTDPMRLAQQMGWPAALNVPRDLAGLAGGYGDESGDMLTGVPEAVLAAVTSPGIICVDYGDYLKHLGQRPGLTRAGVGIAGGDNRVDEAADRALAHLRATIDDGFEVVGGMCILGHPMDGEISELERACERCEADDLAPAGDGCCCAAPLCPDSEMLTCIFVVSTRPA